MQDSSASILNLEQIIYTIKEKTNLYYSKIIESQDQIISEALEHLENNQINLSQLQDLLIYTDNLSDETLNKLDEKTKHLQINYDDELNNFLNSGVNNYYVNNNEKWLIKKANNISPQNAQFILRQDLNTYKFNLDVQTIREIVNKSSELDLKFFLKKYYNPQILTFFLQEIDEINDQETIQHIAIIATEKNDNNLFDLLEQKKSTTSQINYSSLINYTIHKDQNSLTMLTRLLENGGNPNQKSKINNYSDREEILPLQQVSLINDESDYKLPIINKLLEYGAKISLLEDNRYKENIITYLQKNSQYQHLENYLLEFPEERTQARENLLHCAFDSDDPKLLNILIKNGDININQPYPYPDSQNPEFLLKSAVSYGNYNIAEMLAKLKAEVGDYPIIAKTIISHNHQALRTLKALCENGYDYNKTFLQEEKFYFDKIHANYHPLNIAISYNDTEAVKILLNHLTIKEVNDINENPVEKAIYNNSQEITKILINKDIEIPQKSRVNILITCCRKGMLDLLKIFIEQKGFDLNVRSDMYEKGDSLLCPLRAAIASNKIEVAEYLLKQPSLVVDAQLALDTLTTLPINNDPLFKIEDRFVVEIIKKAQNFNCHNNKRENILHLACQKGNKEIYDLLISRNLDPLQFDNSGNNAYLHALYCDNNDRLEISDSNFPFEVSTFKNLLNFIKNHEEKKIKQELEETLSIKIAEYAAKFACLFDEEQLAQYIEKHGKDKETPLHDLTVFSFSQGKFNKQAWAKLAIDNGPKITKRLFLAELIESKLGRAPESIEELESIAKTIKYSRAAEFPKLAEIFHENYIAEFNFNRILDNYKEKTEDHIPDIFIDGSKLGHDRFYMKKLEKNDLRGFILGNKTNCCQYIGAEGSDCAEHGMTSPFGGFYVIFKREREGRVNNLTNWIKNLEQSEYEQDFLKSFSEKITRNKYLGIINNLKKEHNNNIDFSTIKQILKTDFEKELEGEIVAQSWVWISNDNSLVIDSWERLREEDDKLFKPFMKKLGEEILTKNSEIKEITIGTGGYTPQNAGLNKIANAKIPKDYKLYRDSDSQFLIAYRDKNLIRTPAALDIEDNRIQELESKFSESIHEQENYRVAKNKNYDILQKLQKSWKERCEERKSTSNVNTR